MSFKVPVTITDAQLVQLQSRARNLMQRKVAVTLSHSFQLQVLDWACDIVTFLQPIESTVPKFSI